MELGLKGKAALVCGASKGLGFACADALAHEGVDVVIVARTRDALEEAARGIATATGVKAIPIAVDITTPEGRAQALQAAARLRHGKAGAYDIVVTNAGGPPPGNFRDWGIEEWQRALNANMVTPIELMRACVDGMIERKWGRIVNITSATVKWPNAILGLSNGARAGLTGFVAGIAREVAPHGVTINNLLPGAFMTDRLMSNMEVSARRAGVDVERQRQSRIKSIPARRFGQPPEFGAACAFLCSEHAGYITGQNWLMDGGAYPGTF